MQMKINLYILFKFQINEIKGIEIESLDMKINIELRPLLHLKVSAFLLKKRKIYLYI